MKNIYYLLLIASVITLILGLGAKFLGLSFISYVGSRGFILATVLLLLYAANCALLDLLKKK